MRLVLVNKFIKGVILICIYFLFVHPFFFFEYYVDFGIEQFVFWLILLVLTFVLVIFIEKKMSSRIIVGFILLSFLISYFPIHNNIYKNMEWKKRIEKFEQLKESSF